MVTKENLGEAIHRHLRHQDTDEHSIMHNHTL